MPLKSYPVNKSLDFSGLGALPIHLGNLNERVFYSFAASNDPPSGGRNVTTEELESLREAALPFRQIKEEAEKRILSIAPIWKQQNALVDLYLLGQKPTLTADEQAKVDQAKSLLEEVQTIRDRSNEIETTLLSGTLVDYQTDAGWDNINAE